MRRLALALVAVTLCPGLGAQGAPDPGPAVPNPYETSRWGTLPAGRSWGGVSGVEVDRDGRSVWIVERCGGNSCADSTLPPILKLNPSGQVVASFGAGLFAVPHGIAVDAEGNVWVTDDTGGAQGIAGKGHQIIKFSPDGKILLRLGTPGVAGAGPDTFNRPTDVVVAPNGDVFVADGHGGNSNARIVKFTRDGRFIKTWGKPGSGPGEFDTPHSLAMDSIGRLFVADLNNLRVQVFDQEGTFLFAWTQFGMPGGLSIDRRDMLYVADSLSGGNRHPGWVRGIRIASVADGRVTAFIADRTPEATPITAAESVAVDADGIVYGGVVPSPMLQRHVPMRSGSAR